MGNQGKLLEKYNAGLFYEPENEADFLDKLSLIMIPEHKKTFQLGCKKLAMEYNRKDLAFEMLTQLKAITSDKIKR